MAGRRAGPAAPWVVAKGDFLRFLQPPLAAQCGAFGLRQRGGRGAELFVGGGTRAPAQQKGEGHAPSISASEAKAEGASCMLEGDEAPTSTPKPAAVPAPPPTPATKPLSTFAVSSMVVDVVVHPE